MPEPQDDTQVMDELEFERYRERLDRYVCAVAGGWYGVADGHETIGANDYPENPRAVPEVTNGAIVAAAVDLMQQVDEWLEGDDDDGAADDDESAA